MNISITFVIGLNEISLKNKREFIRKKCLWDSCQRELFKFVMGIQNCWWEEGWKVKIVCWIKILRDKTISIQWIFKWILFFVIWITFNLSTFIKNVFSNDFVKAAGFLSWSVNFISNKFFFNFCFSVLIGNFYVKIQIKNYSKIINWIKTINFLFHV